MQQNSCFRVQSEQDVGNAKPVRRDRKVTVGNCLYLLVKPTGAKSWNYNYLFAGKCKRLFLGAYPQNGFEHAKTRHQYARHLLARGIDPCDVKVTLGSSAFILQMEEWATEQGRLAVSAIPSRTDASGLAMIGQNPGH